MLPTVSCGHGTPLARQMRPMVIRAAEPAAPSLSKRDTRVLKSWVDWLTFEGEDTEDALMRAAQWFLTNEAV